MQLLTRNLKQYRWQLLAVFLLNIVFSLFGLAVLAFLNQRLLQQEQANLGLLAQFFGLLLLFLTISSLAQISLTSLGHRLVRQMRKQLLKQILDAQYHQLNQLDKSALLASLTSDVHQLAIAFVRLPELVQGCLFVLVASLYLYSLSAPIFLISALWLLITVLISNLAVKRVYAFFHQAREHEERLYQHYQASIDGHRELVLNRQRAQHYYQQEFSPSAEQQYQATVRADSYHAFANNWTNVMILGAVGLIFYLAQAQQWADKQTATTIALTLLFLRTPLLSAVGALPTLLSARVALHKLQALQLPPYQPDFEQAVSLKPDWQQLRLENISYQYPAQQNSQNFALEQINLRLQRGEITFLIGKNGSGKSTLSLLLAGLLPAQKGEIYLDNQQITAEHLRAYQGQISAVFSDFYLFSQLLTDSPEQAEEWLGRLQLKDKVRIEQQALSNTQLSQGQRKRLALLLALLENRPLLILDEWAADQDPSFRRVFYQELLPLLKQRGYSIFAISHDDRYFQMADRLFMIHAGKLRELSAQEREITSRNALDKLEMKNKENNNQTE